MAKHTAAPSKEATFAVILEASNAGGRRAVGDMVPGRPYLLPATECLRLVALKGFTFVAAADAAAAEAEAKRVAAPTEPTAAAAATTAE
jgi:hypothetical protein